MTSGGCLLESGKGKGCKILLRASGKEGSQWLGSSPGRSQTSTPRNRKLPCDVGDRTAVVEDS